MSARDIKDSFKVGSGTVVVADCDLRGDITIGSGTVLHPRCTILAVSGPIILGASNIVEENVIIVNRLKQPMVIGDHNLFEVGCRIESPSIGDWNTFGIRSRISPLVEVGSHCVVGAGCLVLPSPFHHTASANVANSTQEPSSMAEDPIDSSEAEPSESSAAANPTTGNFGLATPAPSVTPSPVPPAAPQPPSDHLPDYTHVFGSDNRRRKASPEGTGQAKALFAKHWEYLRDTLPKHHKLKMF